MRPGTSLPPPLPSRRGGVAPPARPRHIGHGRRRRAPSRRENARARPFFPPPPGGNKQNKKRQKMGAEKTRRGARRARARLEGDTSGATLQTPPVSARPANSSYWSDLGLVHVSAACDHSELMPGMAAGPVPGRFGLRNRDPRILSGARGRARTAAGPRKARRAIAPAMIITGAGWRAHAIARARGGQPPLSSAPRAQRRRARGAQGPARAAAAAASAAPHAHAPSRTFAGLRARAHIRFPGLPPLQVPSPARA